MNEEKGIIMTEHLKYPRTSHLPFSPGATSDDKWISKDGLSFLQNDANELIVTEKMDGSNFTMTHSTCFGRSVDANSNHWDNYAKQIWASFHTEIPEGWRITGENMYARKSVSYNDLPGVFIVFGIWDENDTLLSWDDMNEYTDMLSLPVVSLLYRGHSFSEAVSAWDQSHNEEVSEGYVVRSSEAILANDFSQRVAKYVRKNHVRTSDDWRRRDDYELNTFIN